MNTLKSIENRLRGWIPKEPTFYTHQTAADSQNSLMARWMARAIVLGMVASGLLGVLGTQTGLDHGLSGYAWSAFLIAIPPVSVAIAVAFAKRKEVWQRITET